MSIIRTSLCAIVMLFLFSIFNIAQSRQHTDITYLAMVVYYEARGEPFRGQVAVAQVVINRVHDSRFPKSIQAVVSQRNSQRCQFTWVCRVGLRIPPNNSDWERALLVANYVYYNVGHIEDYSDGSLFFHNKSEMRRNRGYNVIINNHAFYRL